MTKLKKKLIESKTLELLQQRAPGATICPSEIARSLFPENWREHMEDVRDVAEWMSTQNMIDLTQKGKKIAPPYKGPIRLKLRIL